MKRILPLLLVLTASPLLHAQADKPADNKAAMKVIADAYEKIEAGYKKWTHYSTSTYRSEFGNSFSNDLWISDGEGKDRLMRAESVHTEDHGEAVLQFVFKGDELLFMLDRTETSVIDTKTTEVEEKRYYFSGEKAFRITQKKGSFPAGKSTDTSDIKSTELPVGDASEAGQLYRDMHELSMPMMDKLQKMNDDDQPVDFGSAGGTLSGEGWRAIAGSGSREGRFILGWGIKGQSEVTGEPDDLGRLSVDPETKGLTNYLVDAHSKQIIGTLAGRHFGDRSHYNHNDTETSWSQSDRYVTQINNGKWATFDATLYAVTETDKVTVSKGVDLLAPVKKAAAAQLGSSAGWKKFGDQYAYTLHDAHVAQRGSSTVVVVEVTGQVPKVDDEGAFFDLTVTFKLIEDENGGAPKLEWSSTETAQ